jgi:very-short-patch-repair endonuclease
MWKERATPRDWAIADLAVRQHGVVSTAQLRAAEITWTSISTRVKAGRLHRVHRGVYAVGHEALSQEGRWMAAVLAAGTGNPSGRVTILAAWGAVLSHRSAAELWELLPREGGPVHVIRAGDGGRRSRPGLRIHRSRSLGSAQTRLRLGIPVTSPARTLDDLRAAVPSRVLRRATRQAELVGLLSGSSQHSDRTRSDLERDFLSFCRAHRIPPPEVNVRVERFTVDFLWRRERLVVETDSYRYHRGTVAFEDDHRRDLRLRRLGLVVHRYTGDQLGDCPAEIARELRQSLGRGRAAS